MKLVRHVRSVADLGCGTGIWLASFKEAGVSSVLGLDDRAPPEQDQMEIGPHEFRRADLERDIDIGESFDLCVCLEVAQRFADSAAATIVRNSCRLSDVVLFSAAIPGQGGHQHLNERWPSYWADLYSSEGFEALDVIRGRVWNEARVEWQLRQNLLLFANNAGLSRIAPSSDTTIRLSTPLDVVHPTCFEQYRRLAEKTRPAPQRAYRKATLATICGSLAPALGFLGVERIARKIVHNTRAYKLVKMRPLMRPIEGLIRSLRTKP
jgi:SAM-dependent methyltransferase